MRDRAAREETAAQERRDRKQRLTARAEQILNDVDQLEQEQKWPDARAALGRAEAALAGGEAGDAIRQRVADARRDLEFVARLDRIGQQRGVDDNKGQQHAAEAVRDYAQAFREFGVDVEALPAEEAIARLQGNPEVAVPVAAALDDWADARWARWAIRKGDSNWQQLITVARGLDPDPLRDRLRAAWNQPLTPESRPDVLRLAQSIDVKVQSPRAILALYKFLARAQLDDDAFRTLQQGQAAHPGDFGLNSALGHRLLIREDYVGAVRYLSMAVTLRPDSLAHLDLGGALFNLRRTDEAVAEDRKAVELAPDYGGAHYNLGVVLQNKGLVDEAIAEYRKAIALMPNPDYPEAHYNLGIALRDKGDLDEAASEFQKAVALKPDDALTHYNLGATLRLRCEFRQALEEVRRAHELGSRDPHWRYPSAEWVRQCERLVELEPKLPDILDGKITPASADERIELAGLCSLKHLNGAAAHFYEDAFAAEPKLADDLVAAYRYNAACAAAGAGCGQGKDAGQLEEKEKARLRGQARDWLQADLDALGRLLDKGADQARSAAAVGNALKQLQEQPALAGVRGPEALAKLPEAERQAWHKFWDDAGDMLARAQAKMAPEKK
jgi:Flp pilus assembly protein TadD